MSLYAVLDIGNSTVSLSLFDADTSPVTAPVVLRAYLANSDAASPGRLVDFLSTTIRGYSQAPLSGVALCSVVPALSTVVSQTVRTAFGLQPLVLTSSMDCGLANGYDQPSGLGVDRLAAAAGAWSLYPDSQLIVVDIGTATTVDLVSDDAVFRGGYIVPGPGTWLASLRANTAQLPDLSFSAAGLAGPGLSTTACIENGLRTAYPAVLASLVGQLRSRCAADRAVRILLTGGLAGQFSLGMQEEQNPDLVARGSLLMVLNDRQRSKSQ